MGVIILKSRNCVVCGIKQNTDNTYLRSGGKYLNSYCKKCHKEKSNAWVSQSKESLSIGRYRRLYGVTEQQYAQIIANGCAVCGTYENLCIDHDHSCCPVERTCGRCLRGCLCRKHNAILGMVSDSAEELQKMAEYVLQSNSNHATMNDNG